MSEEIVFNTALVCGGAGYIGSFVTRYLMKICKKVVVVDNFSNGHRASIEGLDITLCEGDVCDKVFLDKVFKDHKPDVVVHLCASIIVGESMTKPLEYYRNNVDGFLTLCECMRDNGCKNIIFSSTCTVFGEPQRIPIDEKNTYSALNPYAETKEVCEFILRWMRDVYDFKYVLFRYFNVAGGAIDGTFGEDHDPETHLIPLVLQVALGQRDHLDILGTDYPTRDGTCVRDYIHAADIALAHVCACKYLKNGGKSDDFNLGNGKGFTVLEVVEACRKATGHPIPVQMKGRRAGDAVEMYSSSQKAIDVLGWHAQYPNLDEIVQSAWAWHSKHPHGYGGH
jgi:UDP-glucose 4-epimerase